jgi:Spy/CpxP family protein refolding chaperone
MTLKSWRIGLTVGAAILVLGMASNWASAQNTNGGPGPFSGDGRGRGRGPGGPGGPGGPMAFLEPLRMAASQLGVTDSQKDQIKAIADSHADEWRGLADRERQARQALQTAIAAAQFDEVTIRQRSAELGAVDADAAVARARVRAEVFQVLTPDQQAKMKELESQGPRGRGRRG